MSRRSGVDERIVIRRPVPEVYGFYSDMTNFPRFLGDVLDVTMLDRDRARWTVALPLRARIRWTTRVVHREQDRRVVFRTRLRWTASTWDVGFSAVDATSTLVREQLSFPGGRLGLLVLAAVGKHPDAEVRHNLHRLQQVLETGRATDSGSTMGKRFSGDG